MDAIRCAHCGNTEAEAQPLCWCGVTTTCDLCDGRGCRACGMEGWWAQPYQDERVDPGVEEMDLGWDWMDARHERAEAEEGR